MVSNCIGSLEVCHTVAAAAAAVAAVLAPATAMAAGSL
jgi:hypothetical protein